MSGALAVANPRRIKAAHRRRRKTAVGLFVQRYYDPDIGRFLSVDPVSADPSNGALFNRYMYASNNPYRFYDPDGREDKEIKEKHVRTDWRSLDAHPSLAGANGSSLSLGTSSQSQQSKNPAGTIASAQGLAADAGSVATNRAANNWAQLGLRAGEEAEMWKGMSRILGRFGATLGGAAGVSEVANPEDASEFGHGLAALGLAGATAFRIVAPPAALAVGAADFAVSFISYKSTLANPGKQYTGWSAINAAGADGIANTADRDAQNGPVVY